MTATRNSRRAARASPLRLVAALVAAVGSVQCGSPRPAEGPSRSRAHASTSGVAGAGSPAATSRASPPIRWVGRTDPSDPAAVRFAWSGTGFVAIVNGPKISVALQTVGGAAADLSKPVVFQPVVDGQPGGRFEVAPGTAQTVVLGSGLATGDHTVELYRETEGAYGHTVFQGFVDGIVKGAPPAPGRLIEIVGDSISAGYGNLGNEMHSPDRNLCTFSTDTESAYQAYGSVVGRTLGADVSIIARSGWGMIRDYRGNTANVLPSIYGNTLGVESAPPWGFESKPDAVVVNLGTNDTALGDPGPAFETAYVEFLHTVRGHYPAAWIFLTIGPMIGDSILSAMRAHLANVVTAMADAKITTIDIATQSMASTGCDYHPDVAEDQVIAPLVTAAIRAKLSW